MRELNRIVVRVGNPYSPSRKCIAPAIISAIGAGGALASGLGSLGSAIGSIFNTNSTNKTNERMQRETNDLNYKIHQEQMAAARKQYEDEVAENRFLTQQARDWQLADTQSDREYNSAKAQVQRFREAGLNPALAMYGGAGSVASQSSPPPQGSNPSGSVPDAPQMVAPHNESIPFDRIGAGITNASAQFLQYAKQSADIAAQREMVKNDTVRAISEAAKNHSESKYITEQMNLALKQLEHYDESFASTMALQDSAAKLNLTQSAYYELKGETEKALADAQIMLINSNIDLNSHQIRFIGQQIDESIQRIASMQNADQMQGAYLRNLVIHMINSDANAFEQIGISKDLLSSQKFKNYVGTVVDGIGTAAATYFGVRRGMSFTNGGIPVPDDYHNKMHINLSPAEYHKYVLGQ